MRVVGKLLVVVALAASSLGATAASASAATNPANFTWASAGPVLANASQVTLPGTVGPDGCSFSAPDLKLAPDEAALEADQVAVDLADCQAIWQIGTPTTTDAQVPVDPGAQLSQNGVDTSLVTPATSVSGGPDTTSVSAATLHSTSGYEKAWLTDPVNITLTSDQSNIAWAWDGICDRSASGSTTWTWHSSTGWSSPKNSYNWISQSCADDRVWSGADFSDNDFWTDPCWPLTTWSHYKDVMVRGEYNGWMYGSVASMSYSGSCVTLYLHAKLVRQTG